MVKRHETSWSRLIVLDRPQRFLKGQIITLAVRGKCGGEEGWIRCLHVYMSREKAAHAHRSTYQVARVAQTAAKIHAGNRKRSTHTHTHSNQCTRKERCGGSLQLQWGDKNVTTSLFHLPIPTSNRSISLTLLFIIYIIWIAQHEYDNKEMDSRIDSIMQKFFYRNSVGEYKLCHLMHDT